MAFVRAVEVEEVCGACVHWNQGTTCGIQDKAQQRQCSIAEGMCRPS